MTPRKRTSRIYWRVRGGESRAYGDFRDLGGGREALIAEGERLATTDSDVAQVLPNQRVKALIAARRDRGIRGNSGTRPLEPSSHCISTPRPSPVASHPNGSPLPTHTSAACSQFSERTGTRAPSPCRTSAA